VDLLSLGTLSMYVAIKGKVKNPATSSFSHSHTLAPRLY